MTPNIIALLFNGLTLALALGLLILILWQDPNSEANRLFSLFLFMVVLWSSGSLLGRAAAYVNAGQSTIQAGLRLLDAGFSGASVSLYIYSAVITGLRGRWFRVMALASLGVVFAYQVLLLLTDSARAYEVTPDGVLRYSFGVSSILLYLAFQVSTIMLIWRNRRKVRAHTLAGGILLFSAGQMLGLLSPRFRELGVAEDVSSIAALMMSYSVVRQQIMTPLLGRAKQLEAVRDVGLAITSRLHLQDTLSTIAAQAAGLLEADGAAIFLKQGMVLELSAVYNLPQQYVGIEVPMGQGVVGTVALEQRGRRVDNYRRDWKGEAELPLAREMFGAVICVPLVFASEVVGVLFVIQGRQGRLFNREDMHLLNLLGPQAAVAITNSRLFGAERKLSEDLVVAKNQLETVLTSTESPVVAVDHKFQVVFANPAAVNLLESTGSGLVGHRLFDLIPAEFLPPKPLQALRDLRRQRMYIYEIVVEQRTYLCHIAELGKPRGEGWVVVLNDVTQLKELDRLKSQMVRMTSHDLKNPLQAAMSYVELLTEDGKSIFTDDMQEYVDIIWMQLTRMYRIISGILDLERVQAGTPAFELCALPGVLRRVFEEMDSQAQAKGLVMRLVVDSKLPPVLGDQQQLGQAFINLVENAIKFTPSGGEVEITAEADSRHVLVHVADTGIGIPLEEQPRVFDRFFRGKQQGLVHTGGSGLGLSLVKAVVDRHNGEISLDSEQGRGTVVHVKLPVADYADWQGEEHADLHSQRRSG
ncbi:MAG: GAF domain-containing protein [Anaerolineae bacterium]|jgi:signal transduction histidine kinase|nr:GAF domain-containing protein [Anaerolineae bacterium]